MDDLTFRLGEPVARTLTITTGTPPVPVNLAGATLTFVVRELDGAADLVSKALALTGQPGEASLALTAAQLAALTAGRTYRFKVLDGAGASKAEGWCLVVSEWGVI